MAAAAPWLLLLLAVPACGGSLGSDRPSTPAGVASPVDVVTVTRLDITPVIVTRGSVVGNPTVLLLAPAKGVVRFATARPQPDQDVPIASGSTVATVAGQPVTSPAPGEILAWRVADGADVGAGVPLAEVRLAALAVSSEVPAESAFRVLNEAGKGRAQVDGGPGPFDCPLVVPERQDAPTPISLCLIPPDVPVRPGLSAALALAYDTRPKVLALPVTAVAGRTTRGTVEVVAADGSRAQKDVKLGVTDGVNVEVLEGVAEGDKVSALAPNLSGRAGK